MKKAINYFVILCGIVGLYFSYVGLQKFPDKRLLFIITLAGCLSAILLGIFDTFLFRKKIDNEITRIMLAIFSGIILISAGLYILFFISSSFIMKGIIIFAIIFFSIAVVKSILKLFNILKKIKKKD